MSFVFLDFDGVIMDSMGLKLESYRHAFEGHGFDLPSLRKIQLETAGLSRYKTLPIMYEALAGRPMPEDLYLRALDRFTAHDEASRGQMRLRRGAEAFFAAAAAGGIPLAIVTGTPQETIDRTVDHFHLRGHFQRVCGAPVGKGEHLGRMLAEFGLEPYSCLYCGDAVKDQEAAASAGIPFVGLDGGDHPFKPQGLVGEIRYLDELAAFF